VYSLYTLIPRKGVHTIQKQLYQLSRLSFWLSKINQYLFVSFAKRDDGVEGTVSCCYVYF